MSSRIAGETQRRPVSKQTNKQIYKLLKGVNQLLSTFIIKVTKFDLFV